VNVIIVQHDRWESDQPAHDIGREIQPFGPPPRQNRLNNLDESAVQADDQERVSPRAPDVYPRNRVEGPDDEEREDHEQNQMGGLVEIGRADILARRDGCEGEQHDQRGPHGDGQPRTS